MNIDEKFEIWMKSVSPELVDDIKGDIAEAAYTISEKQLLEFDLTGDDLIFAWRVVEAIRRNGYPEDLTM
jgi:hypothetical protein